MQAHDYTLATFGITNPTYNVEVIVVYAPLLYLTIIVHFADIDPSVGPTEVRFREFRDYVRDI